MLTSLLLLLLSITVCLLAPDSYSYYYCIVLTIIFLAIAVWHIKRFSFGNYLNFHFLFFISYFFANFVYPAFLYPTNKNYLSFYNYTFSDGIINQATALALVGASAFVFGSNVQLMRPAPTNSRPASFQYKKYVSFLKVVSYTVFGLFLWFVGRDFFYGIFNSESETSDYYLIAFQTIVSLTVVVIGYSMRDQFRGSIADYGAKFGKLFILFLLSFILFFFLQGNRGPALQLVLVLSAFYSTFVKRIKVRSLIICIIIGMLAMTFISNARVTRTSGYQGKTAYSGYFERGLAGMEINSILDIGGELVNANRNLFFDLDYAQKNGYTYGKTMITQVLGIVPGLGSLAVRALSLKENETTSGKLISSKVLGRNATWGIGGNLVGDIYMAFGLFGVVVFMAIFGLINTKLQIYAISSVNIYYVIAYLISVSYALYYPRASFFIALRPILWPILIFALLQLVWREKPKVKLKSTT